MLLCEPTLPQPQPNADSLPYWNGAREGRLLIQQCDDCRATHFMARLLCPACWSNKLAWVPCRGYGTVHSYTVIRRASMATFATMVPYVVALIELDEGPRMVSNILGDDALDVRIGDRVQVTFQDRGDNAKVPQFTRIPS